MHLALENIRSCSSRTKGSCVVSSHLTTISNATEWRLCHPESATSTFSLMAGASAEERQHLHLTHKTQYRYLGQCAGTGTRPNGVRDDDANRFEELKLALKSIGLSKRHVAQTCQLVAAILHLGNIEFTIDCGHDVDAAVVRNVDVLGIIAEFLGVHSKAHLHTR
jgi:myosin heavy subunit